ncbi:MAG: histidine ammonia-lyase [Gammaproteobacteria bacterium]
MEFILTPGQLTYQGIRTLLQESTTLSLDATCYANIEASVNIIKKILADDATVYGINTGFGALANKKIPAKDLELLQRSIVLSHAAGIGELLSDKIVRLILALKINSLARGFSGVRRETIEALIKLFNAGIYPCIPAKGSVGASGDLAPLAHLSLILIGEGQARYKNKIISAVEALKIANLEPIKLAPKEGLALLNGTQVSTALAIIALLAAENVFTSALVTGALSVEAACGSHKPFDERIQEVRGHAAQIQTAAILRNLLGDSDIQASHKDCEKVQDPYSLRCQPQVMGACLMQLRYAHAVLITEANAVSDNPLIFAEQEEIISGGNFHAEPVAFAADAMAISIAEIAALAERRIALLVDSNFSGLPAFLVHESGINSGFMIAQVTAAALASENKSLAHPASVDSLPTSANQEDHVSMATFAARRLFDMVENAAGIIGIELLAACQGIDLRRPLKTSAILETVHQKVRVLIPFYDKDRYFAPDIKQAKAFIESDALWELVGFELIEKC